MEGLKKASGRRLRIAYFSPLPPQRSGISDYSMELLPQLAQLADVTVFAAEPQKVSSSVSSLFPVRELQSYESQRQSFDLPLYHIGNSGYHDEIAELAVHRPGVIALHDFFLHHATAQRTLGAGNRAAYVREMGYAAGAAGIRQALEICDGRETPPVFEIPLNDRLLDASLGVIVHSSFVAEKVRARGFDRSLEIVPALITPHKSASRRAELDLADDAILLASFGLITSEKQIAAVLRAVQKMREQGLNVHYLLVGDRNEDVPLDELIDEADVRDVVHVVGFVPELADFTGWIETADIVVNLRYPTAGETSATALRALAARRPLVVYDHGWYSELPAGAAVKVAPLDDAALLAALQRLVVSPGKRQVLARAGKDYVEKVHAPASVAQAYVAALQAIYAYIVAFDNHG